MRRPLTLVSAAIVAIVILLLGYAWIDGGRRPVRPIAVPVQPEALR
jgi:hypothetical protein